MWRRLILALSISGCTAAPAGLDPATQAKLDKVIALAEERVAEPSAPKAATSASAHAGAIPAPQGPAQYLAVEVSCEGTISETKARVDAFIVSAADGEGGPRLREAKLACPDRASFGLIGPGDFIAVVDYEVPVAEHPNGWAIDWSVTREGENSEQLVKQTWKQGPSASKGHASWKTTLSRLAAR